ncbi:cation-translocating P-type ATPase [Geotalea sp. SG265]|uniref:cation-translocating P-type ATPase n=1 Tax=Geotalea sp. SG265 TaxID=2922867 RepID=UPI001FAEF7C2|nr:cation-translocating P-type ATPase [Geotalea sp. SG265]
MDWHLLPIEDAFHRLNSSQAGISPEEVRRRLEQHGRNQLREKRARPPWIMFLAQFGDFMILVLIAAAVIAGIIGDAGDMAPILAIVILNAIIGFVQEYRAERAIAALKRMAGFNAEVIRGGETQSVAVEEIVPGDVVLLKAGDVVPADLRLSEAYQLKMDEASLTGESFPVEKDTAVLGEASLALGERANMAYKGAVVSSGRGTGLAVATGMETELGKIASMIQAEGDIRTPLQRKLAAFGRRLALLIILVCGVIFAMGYLHGEAPLLMFMTAISLAVAVIPEALPAVVTIALALGAAKMVRQKALIRRLSAVETLGAVTHICTDKTGTLTRNRMTATELFVDGEMISAASVAPAGEVVHDSARFYLLAAAALCNDARMNGDNGLSGDPTETALFVLAMEHGFDPVRLAAEFPRLAELPFDTQRKCMTTIHKNPGGVAGYTKGGLETVLARSSAMLAGSAVVPLDAASFHRANEAMAASGQRVLAVAMGRWASLPADLSSEAVERDLIFIGLVGMEDPPREEAFDAVAQCRTAGIVPVMITGDHPATAAAIARRLAILEGEGEVMTGPRLEELPLEELEKRVEDIRVYARVAPEQKLKIVQALKDRGKYVAMTGDGVNDAPALKRADIGVAMGITGTDVAKEAAAMILLDDNFATIVKAVREGRRIYANILKFITYSISANFGTLVLITLAPFLGLPLPLLPIQILWLNLLCDSLPGLALAVEPVERGAMDRPPIDPASGVFAEGRGWFMVRYGLFIGILAIALQIYAMYVGHSWQTMVFTFLIFSRMAMALAVRSRHQSLLQLGIFSNRQLVAAIVIVAVLHICVVWIPAMQPIFVTQPLDAKEMGLVLALSVAVLLVSELEKTIMRADRKSML